MTLINFNDLKSDIFFPQVGHDIDGRASNDWSGYSVSLSDDGTTVAIGANRNADNGINSGHVRVYENKLGGWAQVGNDIVGKAPWDESGRSVSLSADGKTVAIGAIGKNGKGTLSGLARVYKSGGDFGHWAQVGNDIDGEAPGNYSGYSVSLSDDGKTVAIGAISNTSANGSYSGHVRVYKFDGTGWEKRGNDIDGEAQFDQSGHSVSLSADGKTVAIGATGNDGNGNDSGHARVFKFDVDSDNWEKVGKDIDGEAPGDESGHSVSLSADGTTVAIGAIYNYGVNGRISGHVRVFKFDVVSDNWEKVGKDIDGEAPGNYSGHSVSLSADGKTVAIGATGNDGYNGDNSGHVRVYKFDVDLDNWVKVGNDIDGEALGDESGYSVSLSADGTTVAIGARLNDGSSPPLPGMPTSLKNDNGHVRVYKTCINLNKYISLAVTNTELAVTNTELVVTTTELVVTTTELVVTNTELADTNTALQSELTNLTTDISELKSSNSSLKSTLGSVIKTLNN